MRQGLSRVVAPDSLNLQDAVYSNTEAKEYLELFPNHQLKIIPDAGHSVSVEQPEVYLETIRDFLRQTQPFSIR